MSKILITGGAGFIGSHLCKRLIKDNEIVCLDNLLTGSKENIKELTALENFRFVYADVENKFEGEFDEIYNFACPASPVHYQSDPIKTTKTNIFGIINMLDLANKNNAKILQASTSEVYGDPKIHPQKEEYFGNVNTTGIRSCYDEGKRCAESLVCDYHRQYKTNTKIARIFNTYGPNMAQNDGRVVSNFILQALKNEDITIYGNGSQTRSFCYIDDLVDGIVLLMKNNYHKPINLGNDGEFTILELAEIIIELTNSKSKLKFEPLPKDDPAKRKPDLTKAKEILGYEPKHKLAEGIEKTINYFDEILRKNKQ